MSAVELQTDHFDRLADAMELRLDSYASSVLERVRAKGAAIDRGGEGGWEQIAEFAHESLRAQLRSFRLDLLPEACPAVRARLQDLLVVRLVLFSGCKEELVLFAQPDQGAVDQQPHQNHGYGRPRHG